MSSSTSPLPSNTSEYVRATRSSCASASTALGLTPNVAAIDAFLTSLDQARFSRLCTQHGLSFPLRFPTPTAEVNFLSIVALLNALSGYRTAFHTATGCGAYQNVVRLMIGLYISSADEDRVVGAGTLTAKGMVGLTEARIVELLGVSVHQERQHETLAGVTVGVRGGEMFEAVQLILNAMHGVGRKLEQLNSPSLGAYIVLLLTHAKSENMDDVQATDYLTCNIAQTFPEFRDTHHISALNQDVFLFKRIFFLLHSLRCKFADKLEWCVPDTKLTLPMFVDNVLPTMCVWFNMFNLADQLPNGMERLYDWVRTKHCNADLPRQGLVTGSKQAGPRLSQDETYAIRAATLNLGAAIVQRAKQLAEQCDANRWLQTLNEVDLDAYLWSVAKDDEALRSVPRLVYACIHF